MRSILFFLMAPILLLPLVSKTQASMAVTHSGMIEWKPERKLTWDDYQGQPDPESDAAASTTTLLSISYNFTKTGFTYHIESRFDPSKSWGIHRTPYILSHEQGHFDIAEVFARKLHMKMMAYKFDRKSYQKDLKKIYQDVVEEKVKMQNLYDEETRHSVYRGKQAEWLKKIAMMLEETKEYANYQEL